jgi:hypothetical protein
MGNSKAYEAALVAHDDALGIFEPVRDAYRAGEIGDAEFLAARAAMTKADAAFGIAFAAESEAT